MVDGAMDALDRDRARSWCASATACSSRTRASRRCSTCSSSVGAEPIGLRRRRRTGIVPDALQAALARRPVAVFLQPRAQNPAGVSIDRRPGRGAGRPAARRPASWWSRTTTPATSPAPDWSASAATCPAARCTSRSFSKSHGPDLRLAAVGGAGEVVAGAGRPAPARPGLVEPPAAGACWSSCSTTRPPSTSWPTARTTYAERREHAGRPRSTGAAWPSTGTDGINLWVEVRDEQSALLTLARPGIGVAPGAPFLVSGAADAGDHLRLTSGLVRGEVRDAGRPGGRRPPPAPRRGPAGVPGG